MKKGNQFYLTVSIYDENDILLNIDIVKKVQFNIDNITKVYDGLNEEVIYEEINNCFKIYLTEEETFNFKDTIQIDARVLDKNNLIFGTLVYTQPILDTVSEEKLNVEIENN